MRYMMRAYRECDVLCLQETHGFEEDLHTLHEFIPEEGNIFHRTLDGNHGSLITIIKKKNLPPMRILKYSSGGIILMEKDIGIILTLIQIVILH